MVPQVPDRLPQVRLRRGTEDFRGRPLTLCILRPEQDAPPVAAIVGATNGETNSDGLTVELDGGQIVQDCVGRTGNTIASGLCRHAEPFGLVWSKIRTGLGYAILRRGSGSDLRLRAAPRMGSAKTSGRTGPPPRPPASVAKAAAAGTRRAPAD